MQCYPMGAPQTFTLSELEARSGFDKRTISYYISERLLPKVGRRGPKTTYPRAFYDRLMFIRRVRDIQDGGNLRAVTLREIREVMLRLSTEDFRAASLDQHDRDWYRRLFEAPDWESSVPVFTAEEVAAAPGPYIREAVADMDGEPDASGPVDEEAPSRVLMRSGDSDQSAAKPRRPLYAKAESQKAQLPQPDTEAGDLLREIERLASHKRKMFGLRSWDKLLHVPITKNIALSVKNLDEDDAALVEHLAGLLKRYWQVNS